MKIWDRLTGREGNAPTAPQPSPDGGHSGGSPAPPCEPLLYGGWEGFIPPRSLWAGPGDPFVHFIRWPWEYLAYLTLLCGMRRDAAVLEIGCNHGRTMLGLTQYLRPPGRYEGLDILRPHVEFANKAFATLPFPARFTVADV
jgi:hypothetical protein